MHNRDNENSFCVYVHVFPNGKRYVGITYRDPEKRWGPNGTYYSRSQVAICAAIRYFGWNSITHIVLLENLNRETAEEAETYLIGMMKTMDREFGYNIRSGGFVNGALAEETKIKISLAKKGKPLTEEARIHLAKISANNRGRTASAEHREKIGRAHRGKPQSIARQLTLAVVHEGNRNRICSEETKAKMRKAHEGITHNAETRAKLSRLARGRVFSVEHRAKIREARKKQVFSAETKAKMSATKTGKVFSAETRAKMSEANRRRALSRKTEKE